MRLDAGNHIAGVLALAKPKLEGLKKATNGIETLFMKNLLGEMRKGTHQFGEGPGSDIYQDLMDQSLSETIGKNGTLGISQMLFKQLSPRIIGQVEAQVRLEAQAERNSHGDHRDDYRSDAIVQVPGIPPPTGHKPSPRFPPLRPTGVRAKRGTDSKERDLTGGGSQVDISSLSGSGRGFRNLSPNPLSSAGAQVEGEHAQLSRPARRGTAES